MRFIFDQKIEVKRPTLYSAHEEYFKVGYIYGMIMTLKAEDVILTDGDPSKGFKLITDIDTDIKEADMLVYDGDKYIVKAIRKYNFRSLSRIEAFIYKANN